MQPGGWGKPPVDAQGNALYGDVFGLADDDDDSDAGGCVKGAVLGWVALGFGGGEGRLALATQAASWQCRQPSRGDLHS